MALANHKKGLIPLKRAFLGESQQPAMRLSNQISSFRMATHQMQLTFMLHYIIQGFPTDVFLNWEVV